MTARITPEDLVAHALGGLAPTDRERVDAALERDLDLRRRLDDVVTHLAIYDRLPPAPPAPPFARLAAALPDSTPGRGPRAFPVWRVAALAAAAVLVGILLLDRRSPAPGAGGTAADVLRVVPGVGLEVVRAGKRLAADAAGTARRGDVLACTRPAEARLGERVRVVLDGGARLALEEGNAVTLVEGRAWFEVAPGPFEIRTPYGPVRVLGTAFDVDLRNGHLEVGVVHGRVAAAGHEIGPGERLSEGRVAQVAGGAAGDVGTWFRRPVLRLEAESAGPHPRGTPLVLRLVFQNAGQIPWRLPGPGTARTAIWLGFETVAGRVVQEVPVLRTNVIAGADVLRPGPGEILAPGQMRSVTIKILPPVGSPGAYRLRALWRPAGRTSVLSTPLEFEVR